MFKLPVTVTVYGSISAICVHVLVNFVVLTTLTTYRLSFAHTGIQIQNVPITSTLQKVFIRNSDARCVDGSQASYYVRHAQTNHGSATMTPNFVFYFEDGGAGCISGDVKSCDKYVTENPYFITSSDRMHPKSMTGYAIFSHDSPWANSTMVYVPYCSADAWMFSGVGSSKNEYNPNYYTRGSTIFKAVLNEVLQDRPVMNTSLVLVGSSAGAIGVMFHLSYIITRLGFSVRNVKVVLDSWYVPSPRTPVDPQLKLALFAQTGDIRTNVTWVNELPCVLAYDCMFSKGYIPSGIKTLIVTSSYDIAVLGLSRSLSAQYNPDATLVSQLSSLGGSIVQGALEMYSRQSPHVTFFVASCTNHIYISPFDPVYRIVQNAWSDQDISNAIANSNQQLTLSAKLNDIVSISISYGPFRWYESNFGGSQFTGIYHVGDSLSQMVNTWNGASTADIAGTLCLDSIKECSVYCTGDHLVTTSVKKKTELLNISLLIIGIGIFSIVTILTTLSLLDNADNADVVNAVSTSGKEKSTKSLKKSAKAFQNLVLSIMDEASSGERRNTVPYNINDFNSLYQQTGVLHALDRFQSRRDIVPQSTADIQFAMWSHHQRLSAKTIVRYVETYWSNIRSNQSNKSWQHWLKSCSGQYAVSWSHLKLRPGEKGPLLLNNCWGQFRFGRLACIFGSSGSGKSTLLNVLAGKTKDGLFSGSFQKHSLLHCQRIHNGVDIGFVDQFNTGCLPKLTVQQNIYFRIKLCSKMLLGSQESVTAKVDDILERVGLTARRAVQVESLSGGQLKRIAIGMELIKNTPALFLDEPTSGLDATSSLEVMTLLKKESSVYGKCVVVVIHQPRNEIFRLIDDLMVIKSGRTLYCSSCKDFIDVMLPKLAPLATDSLGDRIVDHITRHDDFEDIRDQCFPEIRAMVDDLESMDVTNVDSELTTSPASDVCKYEHLSEQVEAVAQLLFTTSTILNIRQADNLNWQSVMLFDARKASRISSVINHGLKLGVVPDLEGKIQCIAPSSSKRGLVFSAIEHLNITALLCQRLFRSTGGLGGCITPILIMVGIYFVIGLYRISFWSILDVIASCAVYVFFPPTLVIIALSVEMDSNYKAIYTEMSDGLYSYPSMLFSFVVVFGFISTVMTLVSGLSIFIIDPKISFMGAITGILYIILASWFTVNESIFAVVLGTTLCGINSDATVAMRISTIVVTLIGIFNGILVNILKFPEGIRYLISSNPLFIALSANLYNALGGACDFELAPGLSLDGDTCRTVVLTGFGYEPYGEIGRGALLVMCWIALFLAAAGWIMKRAVSKLPVILQQPSIDYYTVAKKSSERLLYQAIRRGQDRHVSLSRANNSFDNSTGLPAQKLETISIEQTAIEISL